MIGDQLFVEVEGAEVLGVESQDVHMTPARSGERPPPIPPQQRDARDEIVEYPDRAPNELVREMKEPDNTGAIAQEATGRNSCAKAFNRYQNCPSTTFANTGNS